MASTDEKRVSTFTPLGTVRKADTAALVTTGTDSFPEDSFVGSYYTGGSNSSTAILEPYYKPGTLHALVLQNNILAQCVAAMEVNIDGTGHSIDLIEGKVENEAEKQLLTDFFNEPYPGRSMITIRREARSDLEETGNAYIEAMRSGDDRVVMLNNLVSHDIRLVRMDDAVVATKTVIRGGEELKLQVKVRERRFVQLVNGKKVFFKEFGASRDLNVLTGEWAPAGTRLDVKDRASELIHLTGDKEPKTPYGSPRWLNQLPSVLGSRKAEEFNLEYFDAGGLPPVLVIVQGGYLGVEVKEQLQNHLSGGVSRHRAAIVEAISSSGSLDSAGSVQVKLERFGDSRMSDSMFQNYDKSCEEHVRVAFRLPQMFIGKGGDYSYATAYTAYMVAEAQVFWPERQEFDELINNTVVKALGVKNHRFRSLPLTILNVDNQLKALGMVQDKLVNGSEVVDALNEITGLGLVYEKQEAPAPAPPSVGKIGPLTGLPYTQPVPPRHQEAPEEPTEATEAQEEEGTPTPTQKDEKTLGPIELAGRWCDAMSLGYGSTVIATTGVIDDEAVVGMVAALKGEDLRAFNNALADITMKEVMLDHQGLGELAGCASKLVN